MKTSPKRSYSVIENERFELVFAKTVSINSGTGQTGGTFILYNRLDKNTGRVCWKYMFERRGMDWFQAIRICKSDKFFSIHVVYKHGVNKRKFRGLFQA